MSKKCRKQKKNAIDAIMIKNIEKKVMITVEKIAK